MRSYYGTSEVQGEVGHSMRMEDEVVPMYRMGVCMEVHGGHGAGSEYGAGSSGGAKHVRGE